MERTDPTHQTRARSRRSYGSHSVPLARPYRSSPKYLDIKRGSVISPRCDTITVVATRQNVSKSTSNRDRLANHNEGCWCQVGQESSHSPHPLLPHEATPSNSLALASAMEHKESTFRPSTGITVQWVPRFNGAP